MSVYPTSPSPSPCLHSPNVCAAFNGKVETCFPQVAPAQLFCCCLCLCLLLLGLFEVQGRILFACSVQGERGRPRGGTGHIQKKKRGFISHTHTHEHTFCAAQFVGKFVYSLFPFSYFPFPIFVFISFFVVHFLVLFAFYVNVCTVPLSLLPSLFFPPTKGSNPFPGLNPTT